jgi:transcriptional regulator with XRE-family HTH domain
VAKARKSSTHHWILPFPEVGIPLLIRQRRLEAELSQSQFGKLLKVTTQQVQKLETPGKSNPTIRTLNKASDVLNASLEIEIAS